MEYWYKVFVNINFESFDRASRDRVGVLLAFESPMSFMYFLAPFIRTPFCPILGKQDIHSRVFFEDVLHILKKYSANIGEFSPKMYVSWENVRPIFANTDLNVFLAQFTYSFACLLVVHWENKTSIREFSSKMYVFWENIQSTPRVSTKDTSPGQMFVQYSPY